VKEAIKGSPEKTLKIKRGADGGAAMQSGHGRGVQNPVGNGSGVGVKGGGGPGGLGDDREGAKKRKKKAESANAVSSATGKGGKKGRERTKRPGPKTKKKITVARKT